MAGGDNTTTITQDIYAAPFGQWGLMAALGLQGSKISEIHPSRRVLPAEAAYPS
jgi:hypothetical protein